MSKKKIVDVTSNTSTKAPREPFKPSAENKKRATTHRIIAIVLWIAAIGLEVFAITRLNIDPTPIVLLIILIVGIGILAIIGSLLWKKANRLDPASEKNKVKFFIQNQLGLIISIIAFLPLIILLLTNKDIDKKNKGIIAAVAIVALLVAGYMGLETNPQSVEKYTQEAARVEELMGIDHVYWTKSGTRYHLFEDCHHINRDVTTEIFKGTVANAYEEKKIEELCKTCENRAQKLLDESTVPDTEEPVVTEETDG